MKKISILVLSMMLVVSVTNAQNKTANSLTYKTAAGIKIWNGGGLTLKTFLDQKNALEFIGFFNNAGTRITGLYEIHGDLNTESNLKWYIGPGAHVGFYKGSNTFVGIDGVIGMDYKFKNLPLNLSLDWQPTFEFGDGRGFYGDWGGLGVRYTF
ncbi:hypothetical protein ACQ33O_05960 [Ferruginibacter sp. SUN002]|uniref:hypothetical protein n=1 Tax=Ferruginibacter sp. SUN002 TaxID=2937789 RepID=UPI003D364B06